MTTNSDNLVLIPGLMCDHAVWEPVLPALRQTPGLHLGAVHVLGEDHGVKLAEMLARQELGLVRPMPPYRQQRLGRHGG